MAMSKLPGEFVCNGRVAKYQSTHLNIEIAGGAINIQYTQGVVSINQIHDAVERINAINALLSETNDSNPCRGQ